MKKVAMTILATLALGSAAVAQANDGTLTFTGEVIEDSCVISIDGEGNGDATVMLPVVSATNLNSPGVTLGTTPFNMTIGSATQACGQKNVLVQFRNSGNVNEAGRLGNSEKDGAANVEVALLNGDRETINLTNNENSKQVEIVDGTATVPFFAEYYATGAATAGDVNTSVEYAVTYP